MAKNFTQPRRNMPVSYNPSSGGRPRYASNHWMLPDGNPDRFAGGQVVTAAEAEPLDDDEVSYRQRVEVVISDGHGILCIRKPGYLLLPGGGVDEGEDTLMAGFRECLEEAGIQPKKLEWEGQVKERTPANHPIAKGADGVMTTFYTGESGGEWEGTHLDREEFAFLPFQDTLNFLAKCIADPEQAWATEHNAERLRLVAKLSKAEVKVAQAPRIMRLSDSEIKADKLMMFDLDGTLRGWREHGFNDPEAIYALQDRLEFLQQLKNAGYTLVGVTNHTSYPSNPVSEDCLRECQERTNYVLGGLLDDIYWMSSYSEELAKPAPAMLLEVMKDFGAKADCYVGDYPAHDEAAAKAAGIPFVDVSDIFGSEIKVADAPVVVPKQEYMLFSQDGKLYVRPKGNRRFEFPTEGKGKRVPYVLPTRWLPSQGVPEPGVHGYEYSFNAGDTEQAPEGFEARDPEDVLKTMYGGMGLSENREYQSIDRARAQAILRALKARKKPVAQPTGLATVPIHAPSGLPQQAVV